MRISDWSSDVCSSDLFGKQQRDLIGRGGDAHRKTSERPVTARHARHAEPARPGRDHRQRDHGIALALDHDRSRRAAIGRQRGGIPLEAQETVRFNRLRRDRIDQPRQRAEERRVGKEGVSTGRSRWSPYTKKKKKKKTKK